MVGHCFGSRNNGQRGKKDGATFCFVDSFPDQQLSLDRLQRRWGLFFLFLNLLQTPKNSRKHSRPRERQESECDHADVIDPDGSGQLPCISNTKKEEDHVSL